MKVPYSYLDKQFEPEIAEEIWQEHVKKIVTRGDFTLGEEVREFEQNFAKLIGSKYCLGVANGTDALEFALWAQDFQDNAEIIVPVNTFIASAASIVTAGLKPVFVDTNDKFVIDPIMIESKITKKTRAILPVHFAGQPCDMKSIMQIAADNGLIVIEDSAQAANAKSNAGSCGTVGAVGCVSFHPQKNLNCWGDGGAILTDSKYLYEKFLLYRNHGMLDRDTYEIASRNSRLDTIHAAVLNFFLPRLESDNNRRIYIAEEYSKAFKNIAYVPKPAANERHTYHLYIMCLKERERRDDLLKHLHYFGIDARVHYPKPLHLQKAFKFLNYKVGDFPNAEDQAKSIVSLPIHQYMDQEEIEYVIDSVQRFFK